MTVISHTLPELKVRDTSPAKPAARKKPRQEKGYKLEPHKGSGGKYDHAQMLRDRISGMTWEQVAAKHGILGHGKYKAGFYTRTIALNSAAARHLKPHEAAKLDGIKDKA